MLRITVLDHDIERMRTCEQAIHLAIKELGLKAEVTVNCEPPYLSRLDVWEKLPALEIEGLVWNRKSVKAFTKEEVVELLRRHYKDGQVANGSG